MRFRAGRAVPLSLNPLFPATRVLLVCFLAAAVLAGCVSRRGAPVVDRAPGTIISPPRAAPPGKPARRPGDARPEIYVVRKGDTLYSVALDHGLDYRELAQWNGITDASVIKEGQQLRMAPPSRPMEAASFAAAGPP